MRMRMMSNPDMTRRSLAGFLLMACLLLGACTSPLAVVNPAVTPAPNAFDQRLQSQLEARLKEMQVPGAVIFVQSARTGAWTTSLGTSNLAAREPMKASMHFRIGSITKTFTGTVILQLAQEGKLRLDDPVAKYQPEVLNGAHITLRELLAMRSGLYNYTDDSHFIQEWIAHPEKVWTPQELVAIAFKHAPSFAPGTKYHYSNTNFILLGMIIEQLTGRPVEQVFQQRIFAPLGMSGTLLPARTSATLPTPYAQGYEKPLPTSQKPGTNPPGKLANMTFWNPSWGWTAGSAISTAHDLAIWVKALATGKLLSPAMQKERLTWSTIAKSDRYGLAVADFDGFIGHNGGLPGYQSFAGYQPEKHETVVVLTNRAERGPADTLAMIIMKDLSA